MNNHQLNWFMGKVCFYQFQPLWIKTKLIIANKGKFKRAMKEKTTRELHINIINGT